VLIELIVPKRHSEIKKILHLHGNVVTRILKDLNNQGLIDVLNDGKKVRYVLSERGKVLRNLILKLKKDDHEPNHGCLEIEYV
jgi:DNA-binding HxlR family transcriptional regulator